MKPTYEHLENLTICTLRDKSNHIVQGYATCHPEDTPSDRVGEYIATIRAEIEYYKLIRRTELLPQMKILGHVYACIANTGSKSYDVKSPEAQLIWRQYWLIHEDYITLGEMVKELKFALAEYIKRRDEMIGQNKEI